MEETNGKAKKGLIIKTWERCRSIGGGGGSGGNKSPSGIRRALMRKSRSWPPSGGSTAAEDEKGGRKRRIAPEGCFSVYVGPQKQRFVIKTEYANHPLFKILLEEAELEYGYNSEGPIELPCNVDLFQKVLVELEYSDEVSQGCSFAKGYGSYRLLSPSRLVSMNKF